MSSPPSSILVGIEFSIFSQMARWSRAGFGANVEIAAASNELHDDETAAEGAR